MVYQEYIINQGTRAVWRRNKLYRTLLVNHVNDIILKNYVQHS